MSTTLKPDDLASYQQQLESLRARIQGDVDQMTDNSLNANSKEASGNLSNAPLHLADLGSDNYDQDFTLGCIETEQETLSLIEGALKRIRIGSYGTCAECGQLIARQRLQAVPYASTCIACARRQENHR